MPKGNRRYRGELPQPVVHPVEAVGVAYKADRYGVYYYGTADALIDAGLARREWLPGQAECPNKGSFTIQLSDRPARYFRCDGDEYGVHFGTTFEEDERERRLREKDRQRGEANKVVRESQAQIAALPASHNDLRAKAIEHWDTMLKFALPYPTGTYGGYGYSESSQQIMSDAMAAIRNELEHGRIEFDHKTRARVIAAHRKQIAEADPAFTTMLQTIVAGAGEADHG